jgi:hypothetical protein
MTSQSEYRICKSDDYGLRCPRVAAIRRDWTELAIEVSIASLLTEKRPEDKSAR